jgi:SOS response regulatory protein OraA/RecX
MITTASPGGKRVAGSRRTKPSLEKDLGGQVAARPPRFARRQNPLALWSAESYLDYSAFSKKGLAEQLEYEGFSKADAKWAADQVDADWNEQAVRSAITYLEYSAFSESELAEQLEYEGFTTKQAKHGASEAYKR